MPGRKKSKTEGQKIAQRKRTYRNKAKKYAKLLAQFPNDKNRKVWEKKLELYQ